MTKRPETLLTTKRNDILDCSYFGSCYLANSNGIYRQKGLIADTLYFMRSLAKPIQFAIAADTNIIDDYKLSDKEIAIFCGSHAGSPIHIEILKKVMKRFQIKVNDFELSAQEPLDTRNFTGRKTKLHNNCSGKHLFMLLMCKYLGYSLKNYTSAEHPIQKLIHKKQTELSEFKSDFLSYDGCGTPLWALSARDIIKAYFNIFHQKKYNKIITAILKNPDIYGGFNRLDTKIIKLSKGKLFSKVGAGGFVIVYNFKKDEIFLLKLTQNNNPIREIILFDTLNKLEWLKTEVPEFEFNQKNQKVAKYCYEFEL